MGKIEVKFKPDDVSWDDIHLVIVEAHSKNISRGIVTGSTKLSGEELEQRIGADGRCVVALADGKLIGTTSVSFFYGRHWYDRGKKVAHSKFTALLPKYQGIGIREEMMQMINDYIKDVGAEMMDGDTPIENTIVRENARRNGFVEVAVRPFIGHYSVVFVKWFGPPPFPRWYCHFRFWLSKMLVMIRYNRQGKKRL